MKVLLTLDFLLQETADAAKKVYNWKEGQSNYAHISSTS